MLTNIQRQKIKEYFKSQPVELVYLCGSQAEGKATPLSDYDFAVLFEEKLSQKERFDLKLKFIGDLGTILSSDRVEIIDLASAPVILRYSAFAPRGEIYVKNEAKRLNFEQETMTHYFDRLYYLKRHSLNSLATIAKKGFEL